MDKAAEIILDLLRIGSTPAALLARSDRARQRGLHLVAKSRRYSGKKAGRIARRGMWWTDRSVALRERALRQ